MSAPHPDMFPFYLHSAAGASAGGGRGDDNEDPTRNPFRLKSAHEADVPGDVIRYEQEIIEADHQSAQGKKAKRHYPADPGPFGPCPICHRSFKSSKALHGHMRCHPDRAWRGMVPPEQGVGGAQMAGASAVEGSTAGSVEGADNWPFRCHDCGANFRTKQALGGHRASHKSKKGCYMVAREGLARLFHGARINNNRNNNNSSSNDDDNDNNNAGIGNNGGGGNDRRDGLGQSLRIVDLNLPPPQEDDEDEEDDGAGKGT